MRDPINIFLLVYSNYVLGKVKNRIALSQTVYAADKKKTQGVWIPPPPVTTGLSYNRIFLCADFLWKTNSLEPLGRFFLLIYLESTLCAPPRSRACMALKNSIKKGVFRIKLKLIISHTNAMITLQFLQIQFFRRYLGPSNLFWSLQKFLA